MTMLCKKLDKAELPMFLNMAGDEWISEIKMDGIRLRCRVNEDGVKLTNRRGVDVTNVFPEIHSLKGNYFVDGELCCIDENGISQFDQVAHRSHCKAPESIKKAMGEYPIIYVIFDILEVNDEDLRNHSWEIRHKCLEALNIQHKCVKYVECATDNLGIMEMWEDITKAGGEGIVLKKRESVYEENGRSDNWLKCKNIFEVDIHFNKFDVHNNGITVENDEGIRVVVNGHQSAEIAESIKNNGDVTLAVRHVGVTKNNKLRQPTCAGIRNEI